MSIFNSEWEAVIGLEVHVQLATESKIFSGSSTNFGAEPNTQACNIDLGLPGVLPVLNKEVLNMAIKFGLATNARINTPTTFARKNYFYPDLPKGYQISQLESPIVEEGYLEIITEQNGNKRIGITRAHLEEDAGKSMHEDFEGMSGIDLNRAGTPLLEIVSEPDLRSPSEAVSYLKSIHSIIRYLEISDGNMAEGSMRCDANVSVRKKGEEILGTRTETKNVNSFRFVEKAIEFEIKRQIGLLESGQEIVQETRLYDSNANVTRSMRSKEFANDYRYFPEPDLLPVVIEQALINNIKDSMPELPQEKKADAHKSGASGTWRNSFIRAPYYREASVRRGIIQDTFETSITWDKGFDFIETLKEKASKAIKEISGKESTVTCRLTHTYPDGLAPYFSYTAYATPSTMIDVWKEIKLATNEICIQEGGTVTHHHAVGRDHRVKGYDLQRPEGFKDMLVSAKEGVDPRSIMNPGVLIDPKGKKYKHWMED